MRACFASLTYSCLSSYSSASLAPPARSGKLRPLLSDVHHVLSLPKYESNVSASISSMCSSVRTCQRTTSLNRDVTSSTLITRNYVKLNTARTVATADVTRSHLCLVDGAEVARPRDVLTDQLLPDKRRQRQHLRAEPYQCCHTLLPQYNGGLSGLTRNSTHITSF